MRLTVPLRTTAAIFLCGALGYSVQGAVAAPQNIEQTPQNIEQGGRKDLNVIIAQQEGENWCWAATGLFTSQYMGTNKDLNQNRYCNIGRGLPESGRCPDEPSEMVNVQAGYRRGGMNVGRAIRVATWNEVMTNIDANAPIPTGYFWSAGGGHMVHIAGYDPSSKEVKVNNTLRGAQRTTWMKYDYLVSNSQWRWAESIIGHSYASNPAPSQPAPTQPAPKPTQPAPKPTQPAPWPTQPAPKPTQPAPTQPAPWPTQPAPKPTQPAPQPTQPAPWPTQPAPQPTQPAPWPTQPAPQPTRPTPTWPGQPGLPGWPLQLNTQERSAVAEATNDSVRRSVEGLFASLRAQSSTSRTVPAAQASDKATISEDRVKVFTLNPEFVRGTSATPFIANGVAALATSADGSRAVVKFDLKGTSAAYTQVISGDDEVRYSSQADTTAVVFEEPQVGAWYKLENGRVTGLNQAAVESVGSGVSVTAYQAIVAKRYADKLEGSQYQKQGKFGGLSTAVK